MKGELTPEEINMNSIGMFRAGVDTVNTPIITEFIIIIIINIIISTFIEYLGIFENGDLSSLHMYTAPAGKCDVIPHLTPL